MKCKQITNIDHGKLLKKTEELCPSCEASQLLLFYEVPNVPVHCTALMPSRKAALNSECGNVSLGFCEQCGFITNVAFVPVKEEDFFSYEDQQFFSQTFNTYARNLAQRLIEKYNIYQNKIVEIGCGKGDFLSLLCELGHNWGVGIDPLFDKGRIESEAAARIEAVPEYYSKKHGCYRCDLLVCRHTLEHIQYPARFIDRLRQAIGDNLATIIFFEVPDVTRILKDLAFWDIYYEHCSYFSPVSLTKLFGNFSFEINELNRAYDNQYLLLEAKAKKTTLKKVLESGESIHSLTQDVRSFASRVATLLNDWRQRIAQLQSQSKRVVVWGAGSKCVGFLTTLGVKDEIEFAIDINPNRQGKFIPGVAKEIKPPEFLKEYKPDMVIIMNSIYIDEIRQMLDDMNVISEITTV